MTARGFYGCEIAGGPTVYCIWCGWRSVRPRMLPLPSPIVDEEAQAVLGIMLFQRKPGVAMRRNLLSEWFFIEQGDPHDFASMSYPDAEAMIPNWPPFDGNWPIQSPAK